MITRRGVGVVLAAVAVFFIASATRVGWAHIADAVIWGAVLLSAVTPWITVPGLTAARSIKFSARDGLPGPVEGDTLEAAIRVSSRSRLPRFFLATRYVQSFDSRPDIERRGLIARIPARAAGVVSSPILLERRGRTSFGNVVIEGGAPFGLFRRRRTFKTLDRVLVYPRWEPMAKVGLLEDTHGSDEGNVRSRTGTGLSGTRRYVSGDARRSVHWRNSARTGRLMVKEFDAQDGQAVVFALFTGQDGPVGDARFEESVRLAASAARPIIESGGHAFIAHPGRLSPAFVSWQAIMERLALIEPADALTPGVPLGPVPSGARVLALISTDPAAPMDELARLATMGHSCAAVIVAEGAAQATSPALAGRGIPVISAQVGETSAAALAMQEGPRRMRQSPRPVESLRVADEQLRAAA
jgi:uncharacterized protein (DUF58 family)